MADYSNKLYHQLEQETGIQTGEQVVSRLPASLRPGLSLGAVSGPTGAGRGLVTQT